MVCFRIVLEFILLGIHTNCKVLPRLDLVTFDLLYCCCRSPLMDTPEHSSTSSSLSFVNVLPGMANGTSQDEIESLVRENEELRNKNRATETQLETFLEPRTVSVSGGEERSLDIAELEEWAGKLRAATDLYEKVKQDVEKLKEVRSCLFPLLIGSVNRY